MTNPCSAFSLLAAVVLAATSALHAQQPTPLLTQPAAKLIAVLTSNASQKEKADACRELAVIGTKDAVPALAALLPDEKINHMARYALEPIPDPSVDQAFRAALGSLKGRPLVGVIGSIGVRKDALAVRDLGNLLQDPDQEVVQAAARSLGSIANSAAIEQLERAFAKRAAATQLALAEGLLRAAETISAATPRAAASIYDSLRASELPSHIRVAALRGAILVRGSNGAPILRDALRDSEYVMFAAAVRTAYQLTSSDATRVLAQELPHLADNDRKILVVQTLGKRSDATALTALNTAAQNEAKPVQIAALLAIAETGNPAAASLLAERVTNADAQISHAALDGLAGLKGKEADAAVESMLQSRDAARRLAAIELTGRRRMTACLPKLFAASTDPDPRVRPAALSKVGELGRVQDADALLDLLPKLSGPDDFEAAEQALGTLYAKSENPGGCSEKIIARLAQAPPPEKGVLLRVLGRMGGASALQAVRAALADTNPSVHTAALSALTEWKTADAAPELLALAKNPANATDRTLALRGYLGLASNTDIPADQRLGMCQEAVKLVKNTDEQKMLLAALGSIDAPEAVDMILPFTNDAGTKEEACAAVTSIAEKLLQKKDGRSAATLVQPLEKVAQTTSNQDLAKKAKALQARAQQAGNKK